MTIHEVPPLHPIPRMTEEERQQCQLGSKAKLLYVRVPVPQEVNHLAAPLEFIKHLENHTLHNFLGSLRKEGFFHIHHEGPRGGFPTEIRIGMMAVPACPESKGVIEQNIELNARMYRATVKELALMSVLEEVKELLLLAPKLAAEDCKSFSEDFYRCAIRIDEVLESCKKA